MLQRCYKDAAKMLQRTFYKSDEKRCLLFEAKYIGRLNGSQSYQQQKKFWKHFLVNSCEAETFFNLWIEF